jgi:hypothetical protein
MVRAVSCLAIGTDTISAVSSEAVGTNVIRTISGLAVVAHTVSAVSSEAVGTNVIRTISGLAVVTYTVSAIRSEAVGTYMVRTVGSDTTNISVGRAVFCNDRSINCVLGINNGKCKCAAGKKGESEAEDQFVSFHGSCSRSV